MASNEIRHLARDLRVLLARIEEAPDSLSIHQSKQLRKELEDVAKELRSRIDWLDPIKVPGALFDPADPSLFGIFAAIALLGQDRVPLKEISQARFYGSGIYAIYYSGNYTLYKPLLHTENPIYVGLAVPELAIAKSPREQGTKLADRLREHQKNIEKAENLSIDDFTCRWLVVATNWEGKAEPALIHLFRPIWNKEVKLIQGFGKHGDKMATRSNRRSPWDTLHEGRKWAKGNKEANVDNQKTPEEIASKLRAHFVSHPPIENLQQVLHDLLSQISVDNT